MPRADAKDASRRNQKWAARRESIIDTSARLFAANGYHATGINELCDANELGKGALYHYIGSKEGLSHLALATIEPGDVVLTTAPAYPIHPYAVIIAGGEVRSIPLGKDSDFFLDMQEAYTNTRPRPRC